MGFLRFSRKERFCGEDSLQKVWDEGASEPDFIVITGPMCGEGDQKHRNVCNGAVIADAIESSDRWFLDG